MGYLQLNRRYRQGTRGQGFEWSASEQADKNTKELQRVEVLIFLAGNSDFIEKGASATLGKAAAEIERMLKAMIKSLENKPLNPWPLEALDPLLQLSWRRTKIFLSFR